MAYKVGVGEKGLGRRRQCNYFLDEELGAGDGCISSLKFQKMIKSIN